MKGDILYEAGGPVPPRIAETIKKDIGKLEPYSIYVGGYKTLLVVFRKQTDSENEDAENIFRKHRLTFVRYEDETGEFPPKCVYCQPTEKGYTYTDFPCPSNQIPAVNLNRLVNGVYPDDLPPLREGDGLYVPPFSTEHQGDYQPVVPGKKEDPGYSGTLPAHVQAVIKKAAKGLHSAISELEEESDARNMLAVSLEKDRQGLLSLCANRVYLHVCSECGKEKETTEFLTYCDCDQGHSIVMVPCNDCHGYYKEVDDKSIQVGGTPCHGCTFGSNFQAEPVYLEYVHSAFDWVTESFFYYYLMGLTERFDMLMQECLDNGLTPTIQILGEQGVESIPFDWDTLRAMPDLDRIYRHHLDTVQEFINTSPPVGKPCR